MHEGPKDTRFIDTKPEIVYRKEGDTVVARGLCPNCGRLGHFGGPCPAVSESLLMCVCHGHAHVQINGRCGWVGDGKGDRCICMVPPEK